jgi:hypothetical protein
LKSDLTILPSNEDQGEFMLKKLLSLILIGFLVFAANLQSLFGQTDAALERNRVERIKTDVYRLEDAGKTKVVVRLRSGAKVKGYITRTGEDSFDVTNYKSNQTVPVVYRDVAQVKPQGDSSKGAKIALGIAGAAAIVVLVLTLPRGGSGICPLGCGPF